MTTIDSVVQQESGSKDKSDFGANYYSLLMEQYKLYVETSNKVSDRRGTTHTFLLTANTLLVTIYSLAAGKDVTIRLAAHPWQLLIPFAGLLMTLAWFALIRSYRTLNAAKFQVIHDIERQLPIRSFGLEWEILAPKQGRSHLTLSKTEQVIPLVFAALYVALAVGSFL